ncbi:MAG: hypothetical protein UY35_C0039G0005, partial [Candidatus Saccharibacteria bacterium GW2011_GWC2_48_9]
VASGKPPIQPQTTAPVINKTETQEKASQAIAQENNVATNTQTPAIKSDSPFFTTEQPAAAIQEPKNQPINTTPPEKIQPATSQKPIEESEIDPQPIKSSSPVNWYKVGIIAIITVIILLLIGGGYFYIMTQTNQVVEAPSPVLTPTENPQPITPEETPAVTINPESEKYSIDNPNYLSIDFENTSAEEIKNKLKTITDTVSTLSLQSPLEFIITDKNNNPVAFPIFAMNAKIQLPASLLKSLDEKFSLYIFNDNSKTRLGLAVQAKDKNVVLTEMLNEEKTLVTDLSPLFISQSPEITNSMFKDGKYYIFSVRYQNLTNDESLSIDYTITDSQLVIGTSKNTLRSILDHISSKKNSQPNNPDTNSSASASLPDCVTELSDKLTSCTNYSCLASNPFAEEKIKNEILGIEDNKCVWTQQLPNNGKMECRLSPDMRQKVAVALKTFNETGQASFSSQTNGTKTTTSSTINGQANPLQEALELGQCKVTGY